MSSSKAWYLLAYTFIMAVAVLVGQLGLLYQIVTLAVTHFIVIVTMLEFRTARVRMYARQIRRGVLQPKDAAATEVCWMLLALLAGNGVMYALLAPERLNVAWFAVSPVLYLVASLLQRVRQNRSREAQRELAQAHFIRVPGQ